MSNRASLTTDLGHVKEQLKRRQEYYGHYYSQAAGPTLQPLHPGQTVRILDYQIKTWESGTVLRAAKEPRSYIVKNNSTEGVFHRTRSHLRPDATNPCAHRPPPAQESTAITPPASPPEETKPPASTVGHPPETSTEPGSPARIPQHSETGGGYVSRSGRTVKAPEFFLKVRFCHDCML